LEIYNLSALGFIILAARKWISSSAEDDQMALPSVDFPNPLPCAYLCGFLYPLPHCIIIKNGLPQLNTATATFIQFAYHSFLRRFSLIYFLSRKKGSAVTLMSDRHSSTSHLQGESTPARIQKTNAMPGNPDTCFPLLRLCIGATTYVSIQKNKATAHENTGKPHTVKNSIICLLILSPITMSYFKEKP
jgi:hypothetical protein